MQHRRPLSEDADRAGWPRQPPAARHATDGRHQAASPASSRHQAPAGSRGSKHTPHIGHGADIGAVPLGSARWEHPVSITDYKMEEVCGGFVTSRATLSNPVCNFGRRQQTTEQQTATTDEV